MWLVFVDVGKGKWIAAFVEEERVLVDEFSSLMMFQELRCLLLSF
ncbi:MAG: hypothetical protein QW222_05600 [Candidatus Bathyarchaeia archaeon]